MYTLIVSILGVVAKRFSQSSGIFVYTPAAQSVCAYPKNETLWVYNLLLKFHIYFEMKLKTFTLNSISVIY
jgi:hypothetical protein